MVMFFVSGIADYVKRRRRGVLVAVGSFGGVWLLGRWAKSKVLELQEKSALEWTARENMRRRFEQNQQDCLFNVLALLPSVADQLFPSLNVEEMTARLKQSQLPGSATVTAGAATGDDEEHRFPANRELLDRKAKLELWEDIKIASVTRVVTALYLLTLVTLLTHVQLNLLGRFYYVDSVLSFRPSSLNQINGGDTTRNLHKARDVGSARDTGVSFEAQRQFLTFSWWLLNRGWWTCKERVGTAVNSRLKSMSLNQSCRFSDMETMLNDIRDTVEYESPRGSGTEEEKYFNMREILLPDDAEDEELVLQQGGNGDEVPVVTKELSSLLDEARDFLDSSDFALVRTACLDACFSVFFDHMHAQFQPPLHQSERLRIEELQPGNPDAVATEKVLPFASLLPFFTREAHNILNGVPNDYLKRLERSAELKAFSAILYSSFDSS